MLGPGWKLARASDHRATISTTYVVVAYGCLLGSRTPLYDFTVSLDWRRVAYYCVGIVHSSVVLRNVA